MSRSRILVIFSIIGAVVTFLYYNTLERGTFVQWKPLGKPPTGKVTRVISVNYVKNVSGDLYHYEGKWVKAEKVLSSPDSTIQLTKCVKLFDLPTLDKFASSKMECKSLGSGSSVGYLTITAIDDTGNVYSWRNAGDLSGKMKWIISVAGAIRGFLVAIPVLVIIDFLRWLKKVVGKTAQHGVL